MGFATSWALAGLAALPLLLALYLLRRRGREMASAALFLWQELAPPAAGRRLSKQRLPPVFWLELAALAALACAAASPWVAGRDARPLLVVLDPSYSLAAGGDDSPRRRAEAALREALAESPTLRPTLVLATAPPQLLGEDLAPEAVAEALGGWRAEAPGADLDAALRLAAERRAPLVLVLTDGPPPEGLPPTVVWWAFGAPRPNLAIVAAGRRAGTASGDAPGIGVGGGSTAAGGEGGGVGPEAARVGEEAAEPAMDELTLEVANFGAAAAEARLTLRQGGEGAAVTRLVPAGETWRLRLPVAAGEDAAVELAADALTLDDAVALPALAARPVNVAFGELPPRLLRSVRQAVDSTGIAGIAAGAGAELLVTPAGEDGDLPAGTWRVVVHREADVSALVGPFAVDVRHPLAAGLAAEGVVWAAGGAAANPPGRPVVVAGSVVLLADLERPDGGHDLHLRLREDLSTLDRSPAWPVLWWNLLRWRQAESPGPARPVARLGEVVAVRLPAGAAEANVFGEGWQTRLPATAGAVRFVPPRVGRYAVEAAGASWDVGVGTLQAEESDLRRRAAGRWGELAAPAAPERLPLGWAVGLVALTLLVGQAALLARGGTR
jgi:hypothetical protein